MAIGPMMSAAQAPSYKSQSSSAGPRVSMAPSGWGGAPKPPPAPPPPPSPLQTAFGAYLGASQPDLLSLQLSNNAYNRGIGYAYQGQGLDAGGLNLNYQSQLGDVNTQIGQNRIDLAAAQRQIPYLNRMQELANQAMGMKAGTDTRNLNSTAAAQGAFVSQGANDQRRDIYGNLANSLATSNTQYDERRSAATDSASKLQMEADNLGLKPGQLKAQLDNGLAKLGLNTAMSVDDLMDGLAKNDLTALKIYYSILQSAQQYAGAFPK